MKKQYRAVVTFDVDFIEAETEEKAKVEIIRDLLFSIKKKSNILVSIFSLNPLEEVGDK